MKSTLRQWDDVVCVIVCWDDGIPQHRFDRMPSYKSNRERSPEEQEEYSVIKEQMEELHEFLPSLGVCSVRKNGCEADDLIWSACRMLDADYLKVVVSNDADLLQCVRYDTVVHSPIKKVEINLENFKDEVGVQPKEYLTYKCMVGDSSDNIPGCYGVGDKTAVKLIEEYGNSPSNLINVATGKNPEAVPMAKGVAGKLEKFGLKGFMDTMATIRLDWDLCGARLSLLGHFADWEEYNAKDVSDFLKRFAFISLQDREFYTVFKPLRSPEGLLMDVMEHGLRMPVIAPERQPIVDKEQIK
jgi:5'-3' exonuclease